MLIIMIMDDCLMFPQIHITGYREEKKFLHGVICNSFGSTRGGIFTFNVIHNCFITSAEVSKSLVLKRSESINMYFIFHCAGSEVISLITFHRMRSPDLLP